MDKIWYLDFRSLYRAGALSSVTSEIEMLQSGSNGSTGNNVGSSDTLELGNYTLCCIKLLYKDHIEIGI